MILTDKEIRKLTLNYKKEKLAKPLIENFTESNLEGATYDVSMSNRIHLMKKGQVIDLKNQSSIEDSYEEYIIDSDGYILSPGEYILISINEGINLPDNIICEVLPKTKFTRIGLIITAQFCNPSYSGYLQLGLKNNNSNPIKIYPEMKIAQYIFKELKSIPTENKLYRNKQNASYNEEKKEEFRGAKFDKEEVQSLLKLRKYIESFTKGDTNV